MDIHERDGDNRTVSQHRKVHGSNFPRAMLNTVLLTHSNWAKGEVVFKLFLC